MSKISEKRLENHLWISLTTLKLQDSNYRFMQKKTPAQILSQGSQYLAIQITNTDSYTTVSSSTEELLLGITVNRNLSFSKRIRVLCSKTNNKLHLLFHISILHEFTQTAYFYNWVRSWLAYGIFSQISQIGGGAGLCHSITLIIWNGWCFFLNIRV